MTEQDSTAAIVPAPWQLAGDGHILISWGQKQRNLRDGFIPTELVPLYKGLINITMFVDYKSSPVGPYRELLYIPGVFAGAGKQPFLSITKIYVDSLASTLSGRKNWGIPKEMAEFTVRKRGGCEQISVGTGSESIASYQLQSFGPRLPVSMDLLPPKLRRFGELLDGLFYSYHFSGSGKIQWSRVSDLRSHRQFFPELGGRSPFLCLKVTDFKLQFPVAESINAWQVRGHPQARSVGPRSVNGESV